MADETAVIEGKKGKFCCCCGSADISAHHGDDGGVDVVCMSCRSEYSVYFDGCVLLDARKERDLLRDEKANLRKALDRELRYTGNYCLAGNGAKGERCVLDAGHDGGHDYGKLDAGELKMLRKLCRDLGAVMGQLRK